MGMKLKPAFVWPISLDTYIHIFGNILSIVSILCDTIGDVILEIAKTGLDSLAEIDDGLAEFRDKLFGEHTLQAHFQIILNNSEISRPLTS